MITKFKIFEDVNVEEHVFIEYWKIPTNDYKLTIALNKIENCPLEREDFYEQNVRYKNESKFGNRRFVYVIKLTRTIIEDALYITKDYVNWHWNIDIKHIKTYKNEFMGDIKISKQEVKDYKIEKDMKKYNL